jgi:hypothetical protein
MNRIGVVVALLAVAVIISWRSWPSSGINTASVLISVVALARHANSSIA